ncbi:MAG: D-alanyl-D-alanine carboxypeptidase [Clostridia bacterium]|nr:D-alanyl-D-alanine carboxypeptidase [Clostridia bacterium]
MKKCVILAAVLCALIFAAKIFAADAPSVSARSAVLVTSDGEVLYEHNADERLPMASTTKIMTCLIAIENCDLDEEITVTSASAGIEGSSLYMKEGDVTTVKDMLYAAMLRSANDAASVLAVHVSWSEKEFAALMNEKARALGMNDTHFTNPHGLPDADHYTSARDFARLASYAMENEIFAGIAGTKEYVVTINGAERKPVKNHNRLLFTYDGCTGVKTGYTRSSGRCLVSTAERDGVRLICVTLSDGNDWHDHTALLDYGFNKLSGDT